MEETRSQVICDGFTVEYRQDGITVYRVESMKREVADAWSATHRKHSEEGYARGEHVRRILDIRHAGVPTPYGLSKAVEAVRDDPPDLQESVAVLVSGSLGFQILTVTLNRLGKWVQNTRLFTSEEDALQWLDERLKQ